MRKNKIMASMAIIVVILTLSACISANTNVNPDTATSLPTAFPMLAAQYFSPLSNADYVSKNTTIAVRYGPTLTSQNVAGLSIIVQGNLSGLHNGQTFLANDQKTIIFKPNQSFVPGEQVQVSVSSLRFDAETLYTALNYTFKVAAN